MLEKNDFAIMKTENERLGGEVLKLKDTLRDEIKRTQAGVRLDMNLEKGRIRDESSIHDFKVKETDTRIESEAALLRKEIESIKLQILQYIIGKFSLCLQRFVIFGQIIH